MKTRPHDRVTDNRSQFHLRWHDHLEDLRTRRFFDPHRHLPGLRGSLSPRQPPPSNAPRPHPADALLRLGLAGLGVLLAILLYHLR